MKSAKRALPWPHDGLSLCQPPMLCSSITRQREKTTPLCFCLYFKDQGTKGGTWAKKTFRQHQWVANPCCVTMATSHVVSTGWFSVHSEVFFSRVWRRPSSCPVKTLLLVLSVTFSCYPIVSHSARLTSSVNAAFSRTCCNVYLAKLQTATVICANNMQMICAEEDINSIIYNNKEGFVIPFLFSEAAVIGVR